MSEIFFEALTPLGFVARCSRVYWDFIVEHKHRILKDCHLKVIAALQDPVEIRQSRKDERVYLFYRPEGKRWICAVVKPEDGVAYLITAYPTDNIKAGVTVWKK